MALGMQTDHTLHLHHGGTYQWEGPTLCGDRAIPTNRRIPYPHWNGNRERVCPECLAVADDRTERQESSRRIPKTITGYLSVSTGADGVRRWRVLSSHNQPLCEDTPDVQRVLAVARDAFGPRAILSVWDGDRGEFVSEMVADPTV